MASEKSIDLEEQTVMQQSQNSQFTKSRTMRQEVSGRLKVCGALTLLVFLAGCDPCLNSPCDDGVACNGSETCTADGGSFVCSDGTPVSCDSPTLCTEPNGECVDPCDGVTCDASETCVDGVCQTVQCNSDADCAADSDLCTDDFCSADGVCVHIPVTDCDDGDNCTDDSCDPATGDCQFLPKVCDAGFTCNPTDGQCQATATLAVCCFETQCQENTQGDMYCTDGGGTPKSGVTCADNPCAP